MESRFRLTLNTVATVEDARPRQIRQVAWATTAGYSTVVVQRFMDLHQPEFSAALHCCVSRLSCKGNSARPVGGEQAGGSGTNPGPAER